MRFRFASRRGAILLPLAALLLAGCGKASPEPAASGGPLRRLAPVAAQGAVSVTTRNTARVGGAGAIVDAAAVARVVYPGLTPSSRPQAVVIVDSRQWPAALAASSLAGAPLNAPILFAEGNSLPQVSLEALEAMSPTGAAALGAQVIEIGTSARLPPRYSVREVPVAEAAEMASAIEHLLALAGGASPHQAIVLASEGERGEQMPAAGLSAESGAPILLAGASALPVASTQTLHAMHHPAIYVIGGASLAKPVLGALAGLGRVTQIPATVSGESPSPAAAAIAAARFTDGTFGWGVKEPGHGLVFANSGRPLDAPAAALLSATANYGPLLLLETPGQIERGLSAYLDDIQPAYTSAPEFRPVRGVYNHGWLIGDERAISLATQAELDTLLEISPRKPGGTEEASLPRAE